MKSGYNLPMCLNLNHLSGVYAAALTPIRSEDNPAYAPGYQPDNEAITTWLDYLATRGCHGALLFGTTGEGPSFAPEERLPMLRKALEVRQAHPDFHLFAGTGTPSLEETISLTAAAFDLGYDGVVVLPPYYYRQVSDEGLYTWFSSVIRRATPTDGAFFGYHIPPVTGVPLSIELISRLKGAFPRQFAGLKDSSGDPDFAQRLGATFGYDLLVFTGNDRLFSQALTYGAGGCITALANLCSPDLRLVWDGFLAGRAEAEAQKRLDAARMVVERYPPMPSILKALAARQAGGSRWLMRPPLTDLPPEETDQAWAAWLQALA